VFDDSLVNGLFDDLENAVLENSRRGNSARTRVDDLADEAVGAKGTGYAVCYAVDERAADKGECGEEYGVAVAYVGEGHGIIW
jgi:hypothetical protein